MARTFFHGGVHTFIIKNFMMSYFLYFFHSNVCNSKGSPNFNGMAFIGKQYNGTSETSTRNGMI